MALPGDVELQTLLARLDRAEQLLRDCREQLLHGGPLRTQLLVYQVTEAGIVVERAYARWRQAVCEGVGRETPP